MPKMITATTLMRHAKTFFFYTSNKLVMTRTFQTANTRQKFTCLDLRESKLSVIERLCLEECLLRHDERQWLIWGIHDPVEARYLKISKLPSYANPNSQCIIVMGIGGKPELLLDVNLVRDHGIWVIKRFSGGGTVVVDRNCLYTTIIGRKDQLSYIPAYPREIMQWTAEEVFGPTFDKLQRRANEIQSHEYPQFDLRENDYVLGGTQKVGGNAQSIVKSGWLHHTTFLWDYSNENMKYLTMPKKRPEYRNDRSHKSFLIKLKDAYQNQLGMESFFESMESVCEYRFELEPATLSEALDIVAGVVGQVGADNPLQSWFDGTGRTRLVDLSD